MMDAKVGLNGSTFPSKFSNSLKMCYLLCNSKSKFHSVSLDRSVENNMRCPEKHQTWYQNLLKGRYIKNDNMKNNH